MKWYQTAFSLSLAAVASCTLTMMAGSIPVPNASFESPAVPFVGVLIDSWQKNPKPPGYVESPPEDTWDQKTGVFKNSPPTSADHIDNCDGEQAIWLFAVPEAGLYQDYHSVDRNDPEPTHEFDTEFQPGSSYRLTAGVIGGGGGMLEGASLEISLYYHDPQTNVVTVGTTRVVHSTALFPNRTHLIDFHVDVPTVQPGDPWAGQRIGVQFISTVGEAFKGGYWDLDNVRLNSIREPALVNPTMTDEGFQFTLLSEPGTKFDVLASEDLKLPSAAWATINTVTNDTGTVTITDGAGRSQRYYDLREVP